MLIDLCISVLLWAHICDQVGPSKLNPNQVADAVNNYFNSLRPRLIVCAVPCGSSLGLAKYTPQLVTKKKHRAPTLSCRAPVSLRAGHRHGSGADGEPAAAGAPPAQGVLPRAGQAAAGRPTWGDTFFVFFPGFFGGGWWIFSCFVFRGSLPTAPH